MKKTLTTVVSLIMVAVMAMFVGCGGSDKETGVIKGDYKEATAQEVATQLNSIDSSKLLGDTTAEDWAAGLSVYFDFNYSAGNEKSSINFNYDLAMAVAQTGMTLKGKGDLSLTYSGESEDGNMDYSGNIYNDEDYIYVDLGEDMKTKISLEDFIELIGSIVGQNLDAGTEIEPGTDDAEDGYLANMVAKLAEMGIKFEMDTSNGTKIKIVVGKEVILSFIGENMAEEAVPELANMLKKCVVEFYVHIDKDSHLVAVTAKVDIQINMGEEMGTYSFDAVMAVRVTKPSTITLPDGIAEDEAYTNGGIIE